MHTYIHIRVYHLSHCEVLLRFFHALYPWKHTGMFHFSKIFIATLTLAIKFFEIKNCKNLKFLKWGVKNKVLTILSFWGLKDAP